MAKFHQKKTLSLCSDVLMQKKRIKTMNISKVDAPIVLRWLSNNEVILIDVHEPAEHSAIHSDIPSSKSE